MRAPAQLSRSEKIDIFLHGIVILWGAFFIYLSLIILLAQLLDYPIEFLEGGTIRQHFQLDYHRMTRIYLLIIVLTMTIGGWITYRSTQKRIRMIHLSHILDQLKFVAQGNYDYRIPQEGLGDLSAVVDSVNRLVDSTQTAMEEERRSEQMKDELIANVSHDIRTPLTSIVGYLDAIENEQYQTEAELFDYIHIAYEKAKYMRTLVNDLFLYTDSLQTTYQIHPHEVPVELYLQQLAAEFELTSSERGMTIEIDVESEDLMGYFDLDKMARVFSNLISNAIKYGVGGRWIQLRAYERGAILFFEVVNDGEPIPEGDYEKIFERSYRSEKSRNSQEPGSGLGLAIVKNIIDLHHGHVYATGEGQRTIFRIELPAYQSTEEEPV